ncbi:MAG: hypothetical protein KC419_08230, partial [Anaerolineales bacterium]|nr:hypothetical protein [Anaerolineales bacterium]
GALFLSFGPTAWLLGTVPALLPFIGAVIVHRRIEASITRLTIWCDLKQDHVARMQLDWDHIPKTLPLPAPFDHPFALDIDLVGEYSVHRLLDTTVSAEGSRRLRDWLINTDPQMDVILQRQAQVRELVGASLFRDKLALNAALVSATKAEKWPGQQMLDWLAKDVDGDHLRPLLIQLAVLAAINIPLFVLDMTGVIGAWWLIPWSIYGVLFVTRGGELVSTLFQDATFLEDGLRTLNGVFRFLENGRFRRMPNVRGVVAPFLDEAERPSQHIKRVTRVVAGVGVRQNPLLGMLLNMAVPWDIYFAYRLHQCRIHLTERMPVWLDRWFELEALSALATFAYLNPDQATFPTLLPEQSTSACLFDAQGLGHPLIADAERICNDFQMPTMGSIALITGSNMAGKSSFLRTVGVNLALSYAGGPGMAQSLHTRLLRLYSSMRVNDSVVDGFSFFYAEVQRLQSLLAALHEADKRPLCFLIDEIFRGTNNRERLIGSRAYIRALAKGCGVGVIATHDLELVQLEHEISTLRNLHFRDDVENGRMVFDYQLRPGPCPTTNALKIMQQAGLPVE